MTTKTSFISNIEIKLYRKILNKKQKTKTKNEYSVVPTRKRINK